MRQGKPGKVWLALFEKQAYLSMPGSTGNYASTPDSAAHTITGDIDIRVKAAADDWTNASTIQTLFAKRATQCAWQFRIAQTTGRLELIWSVDGTALLSVASSAAPTVADGSAIWLRATLDADNGAAGRTVTFYTSDDGETWTQLGTATTTAGITSIFDSNAALEVGSIFTGASQVFDGKIYYAEVRNGIGGTVVAKFDAAQILQSSGTMSTGELWTVHTSGATPARIVHLGDQLVDDPYLLKRGQLDVAVIDDTGESCKISVSYEDRLVDLQRPRERRYTHEDQQIDYPGDKGFEFVPTLQDMQLQWGRKSS